jgi:hypothetical protein
MPSRSVKRSRTRRSAPRRSRSHCRHHSRSHCRRHSRSRHHSHRHSQSRHRSRSRSRKSKSRSSGIPTGKYGVWGKIGSVYSPKLRRYVRLSPGVAVNVIVNELPRNSEWHRRVNYIVKQRTPTGKELKRLLAE